MESAFDAIILGTSLTESILAAALSKAGFKVAHIDVNRWYGGDEASLSLDELVQWAEQAQTSQSRRYTHVHVHNALSPETSQRDSRFYALSLCPSIIPSVGPTIASLVSSGVARYGGFKLVDSISIYDSSSSFKSVPCRREDVFKNAEISLIEKRRIMRFLTLVASSSSSSSSSPPQLDPNTDPEENVVPFLQSQFGLSESTAAAIGYALAFCTSPSDRVRPALARLRRYIRSSGRYGPSPFLIGQYGGAGEMAQGFCRAAAVHGAVYILGRGVLSVDGPSDASAEEDGLYTLLVQDIPDPLKCKLLIASPRMAEYLSSSSSSSSSSLSRLGGPMQIPRSGSEEEAHSIARCIAIVDDFASRDQEEDNTVILSFPPSVFPFGIGSDTHACTVLVTGPGTMSTPRGKIVLYLGLPLVRGETRDARTVLEPYLETTLSHAICSTSSTLSDPAVVLPPPPDATERCIPLLTTFYIEHPYPYGPPPSPHSPETRTRTRRSAYIVTPPVCTDRLPESSDLAAEHAERVFREAVAVLRPRSTSAEGGEEVEEVRMWPPVEAERGEEDDEDEW